MVAQPAVAQQNPVQPNAHLLFQAPLAAVPPQNIPQPQGFKHYCK